MGDIARIQNLMQEACFYFSACVSFESSNTRGFLMLNRTKVITLGKLADVFARWDVENGEREGFRAAVIRLDETLFKTGQIERRGDFAAACGLYDTM
jgi:hypothetical protein